jgi:transcriptional regulator with XRE-family HTH domain
MDFAGRIKLIRDSLGKNQKEMAAAIGASLSAVQSYESGRQVPGGKVIEKLSRMGFDANWLFTGHGMMRRLETNGHVANGNNIIQGAHIDAEDVHLEVHQVGEQLAPIYSDPIDSLFLNDWKSLSDVGKMRVWTLLKEEIQRERG